MENEGVSRASQLVLEDDVQMGETQQKPSDDGTPARQATTENEEKCLTR